MYLYTVHVRKIFRPLVPPAIKHALTTVLQCLVVWPAIKHTLVMVLQRLLARYMWLIHPAAPARLIVCFNMLMIWLWAMALSIISAVLDANVLVKWCQGVSFVTLSQQQFVKNFFDAYCNNTFTYGVYTCTCVYTS